MSKSKSKSTVIPVVISVASIEQSSVNTQHEMDENEVHSDKVSFTRSLRPIYYFSRMFGLMPFSIVHGSNGEAQKPRISKLDGIWFAVAIGSYLAMAYIAFKNIAAEDPNSTSYMLILVDYFIYFSEIFLGILIIGFEMCNRFKLINILREFTTFDTEVRKPITLPDTVRSYS